MDLMTRLRSWMRQQRLNRRSRAWKKLLLALLDLTSKELKELYRAEYLNSNLLLHQPENLDNPQQKKALQEMRQEMQELWWENPWLAKDIVFPTMTLEHLEDLQLAAKDLSNRLP